MGKIIDIMIRIVVKIRFVGSECSKLRYFKC